MTNDWTLSGLFYYLFKSHWTSMTILHREEKRGSGACVFFCMHLQILMQAWYIKFNFLHLCQTWIADKPH